MSGRRLPLSTPPFKGVSDLIDLSEHHLALSWPKVLIPAQPQAASAVLSSVGEVHQPQLAFFKFYYN